MSKKSQTARRLPTWSLRLCMPRPKTVSRCVGISLLYKSIRVHNLRMISGIPSACMQWDEISKTIADILLHCTCLTLSMPCIVSLTAHVGFTLINDSAGSVQIAACAVLPRTLVLVTLQAVLDITGGAVSDPMLFQSVMIEQLADQSRVLKVHAHVSATMLRHKVLPQLLWANLPPFCIYQTVWSVLVIATCYTALSPCLLPACQQLVRHVKQGTYKIRNSNEIITFASACM